ncbi:MAG: TlpA family protein disulfide reductase [Bacteroidaceae bacterium]|nr:TlpA family protein disulfide reductase [Bacteroidaceae bacterium]
MKKTLFPILALSLVCCTPQRQDTQHITITTDDAADRKITLVPMGSRENSVDMTLEDGAYRATVNTSETGFYNLVSVKGSYQVIVPYYVPVSKGESTAHLTFGEVGVPSIESDKDNNALIAYTTTYADNSRAMWKLSKDDTEAGRALLEGYATKADSIISLYHCSKPVAEYIRTWAYINACEGYNSLTRILGIPAKDMPYSREEILPEPHTMLNTSTASLFPSTPNIIYSSIPNKNDLDSALTYVEQYYTDTTLVKKTKETIASVYVSRYNYRNDFDKGLERLQSATERYGLDPRHAEDFAKHRSAVPGQPFPDGIVLQDRDGNIIDFSTFRGKYVYIDMWASWCVPCLREVPVLQELEKKLKNKKVTFVSISIDANKEVWLKKMDEKNMHGHQLWNPEGTLGKALNVKGIPFFAIYDPDGNLYMHGAPRPSQGPGLVELLEGLK